MTIEEESYIIDSIKQIKKETHENNIMLKQIIQYLNQHTLYAEQENMNDFGRNVLANLISNIGSFRI